MRRPRIWRISCSVFLSRSSPSSRIDALDDAGRGLGLQLQERQRRHGLARARFADDGERLALPQIEAHPIHRLHRAEAGEAVGMEVFHLQYDVADLPGHASSLRYFFM